MSQERLLIGVDLGGTKIATVLATDAGRILEEDLRPTEAGDGLERVLDRIGQAVRRVTMGADRSKIFGLGIGVPGPCSPDLGIVYETPNLPGWRDVPLRSMLERRLELPVRIQNDARVAALGEHRFGAGRGTRNMIYVTVSTGIGSGLVLNGQLFSGSSGTAGEFGHIPIAREGPRCNAGHTGCLEALASGTAVARKARELLAGGQDSALRTMAQENEGVVDGVLIGEAARAGDPLALSLIGEAGIYLGMGLAGLVNLLNPEMIVVGGGFSNVGDLLLDPARAEIAARAFARPAADVKMVPVALGGRSGELGAAALLID